MDACKYSSVLFAVYFTYELQIRFPFGCVEHLQDRKNTLRTFVCFCIIQTIRSEAPNMQLAARGDLSFSAPCREPLSGRGVLCFWSATLLSPPGTLLLLTCPYSSICIDTDTDLSLLRPCIPLCLSSTATGFLTTLWV